METCFNYCDKDHGFFSSDELKWINKIHKLKEAHPDKVRIIREPEDNDGCIYCELPASWLKVQPKRTIEMTDEQRQEASERMKALVAKQKLERESPETGL